MVGTTFDDDESISARLSSLLYFSLFYFEWQLLLIKSLTVQEKCIGKQDRYTQKGKGEPTIQEKGKHSKLSRLSSFQGL